MGIAVAIDHREDLRRDRHTRRKVELDDHAIQRERETCGLKVFIKAMRLDRRRQRQQHAKRERTNLHRLSRTAEP